MVLLRVLTCFECVKLRYLRYLFMPCNFFLPLHKYRCFFLTLCFLRRYRVRQESLMVGLLHLLYVLREFLQKPGYKLRYEVPLYQRVARYFCYQCFGSYGGQRLYRYAYFESLGECPYNANYKVLQPFLVNSFTSYFSLHVLVTLTQAVKGKSISLFLSKQGLTPSLLLPRNRCLLA